MILTVEQRHAIDHLIKNHTNSQVQTLGGVGRAGHIRIDE
jgi:hypothetical protein